MNIVTPEADYAVVTAPDTARIQRLLPGPIERVWAYLTDSDLRRRWLAEGAMELRAGAQFELVWHNDELTDPPGRKPDGFGAEHRMQSRIVEVEPPHRLVFTWGERGEVTFELEPRGDKVLLSVLHRGISDRTNLLMIGAGWHAHLDILVARANGQTPPLPYWDGWTRLRGEYARRVSA